MTEAIFLIFELYSSIIFILAGIVGSTKWCIKLKVKVGMNAFCIIANIMWVICCFGNKDYIYMLVGLIYIMLGMISVINFTRIYRKVKKGKEYKLI